MSRGDRSAVSGNLGVSMRNNYDEHGVDNYYRQVHKTYRNPHFPGVKKCLISFFNRWWTHDGQYKNHPIRFLDMAAGSGEATVCLSEWWHLATSMELDSPSQRPCRPRGAKGVLRFTCDAALRPVVAATDPFTMEAYADRTRLPCSPLSFQDLANGKDPGQYICLPGPPISTTPIDDGSAPTLTSNGGAEETVCTDIIVCSFALHLVDSPSELFSLLWVLSTKARWLVILAPHKRPSIKDGWGWSKYNIQRWQPCDMHDSSGELLMERVHCRLYRSLNCE